MVLDPLAPSKNITQHAYLYNIFKQSLRDCLANLETLERAIAKTLESYQEYLPDFNLMKETTWPPAMREYLLGVHVLDDYIMGTGKVGGKAVESGTIPQTIQAR
jgi:hypothetical protein